MYNMIASHTAVQEQEYSEVYYKNITQISQTREMKDLCLSETITLKIVVKRELSKERVSVGGSERLDTDCLLVLLHL